MFPLEEPFDIHTNHAGDDAEFTGELALNAATGEIPELTEASQNSLLPDQRP